VSAPKPYTLDPAGPEVFRNFVIPIPIAATKYVRGIELRADNPTIVHHASVGIDRLHVSRRLDGKDGRSGFAAMPDDSVQNVYGWSPGKAPFMEPADRAWPIEKGSDLVVQMHLLPSGKPEVVQPSIGLFFSSTPPTREPLIVRLESKSIDIPAGDAAYTIEDRYVLPADVDLVSVYPHAHYLAKDMKGTATMPDGRQQPLIWIKSWDFRWQDQYRYRTPMFLPKGTLLEMRYTYDNSAANPHNPRRPPQRVKWGPQSTNEMGALWLEVLPRRPADVPVLLRDYEARSLRADIAGAEMQVRNSPTDPLAHNFLATKYLQAGRVADAMGELEAALHLRPDDAEAHSNLANALQLEGRMPEALQHAQRAAQLKPDDDRVHFNLGNALNAAGRTDDATRELRRSVALNPDNADAQFNLGLLLARQNRLEEASVHLRKAAEINPGNSEAHRNLGLALAMSGHLDEGIAEMREALRVQPDSPQAAKGLADLLRARQGGR
jgi:Flp pilus assembly protein TadD